MSPHSADYNVHLFAAQSSVRGSKVIPLYQERHCTLVHVEYHYELVGHLERLVGGETGGVCDPWSVVTVVVRLVPPQVPAPGLIVIPYKGLITHGVEGRLVGCHTDHGMCSPLLDRPGQLKHVETGLIPDLGADRVGGLGDRMPVQSEKIVFFYIDIEGAVFLVPRVGLHNVSAGRRHVEQQLNPRGHAHLADGKPAPMGRLRRARGNRLLVGVLGAAGHVAASNSLVASAVAL